MLSLNNRGTVKLKPTEELECELVLRGSKTNKGFFSGITGAVTGVIGTPAGIGVLIFIIALVGIYIYVAVMRKKAK